VDDRPSSAMGLVYDGAARVGMHKFGSIASSSISILSREWSVQSVSPLSDECGPFLHSHPQPNPTYPHMATLPHLRIRFVFFLAKKVKVGTAEARGEEGGGGCTRPPESTLTRRSCYDPSSWDFPIPRRAFRCLRRST